MPHPVVYVYLMLISGHSHRSGLQIYQVSRLDLVFGVWPRFISAVTMTRCYMGYAPVHIETGVITR